MNNHSLILVDGSSYLYRAFHALPPLTNSQGEPTGAIYGVINMLRRLFRDYPNNAIAVVFDAKGKTFRDELFADYKAHRPSMPDDLQKQVEPLHAIIHAMGLPLLIIDNVEADDVIGTLTQQAIEQSIPVIISTGDKDFAQLVNDQVTLVNTMTSTMLDRNGVIEKFGVAPEQVIDYLTLVGDSVDNIPGVPNVGPKTAVKWLTEYQTLDNLIAHARDIKGKVGDNLRNSFEQINLSKTLVTIKTDVTLPVKVTDLERQNANNDELQYWFQRLEFKSWLNELTSNSTKTANPTQPAKEFIYDIVLTETEFNQWLNQLEQTELFAFDTETDSLDYISAQIVGVSFAITPGKAAYVPLTHNYPGAPTQLNREYVLNQLKPLLENPEKKKLGHNLKYDMSVLLNHGITLRGIAYDSMLESYVLDSTAGRHDMDSLAMRCLNHKTITFEEIAGKGIKQLTFNQIGLEEAGPYAAEDADITLQLHNALYSQLQENEGLLYTYNELEIPLIPVLSRIERRGVLIDAQLLRGQSQSLGMRLIELEQQAYQLAGQLFNLGSPKQLQIILYEQQGLPILEKTPTGQPSTSENVLQELAINFPLPKVILEYRSLSKLKSTYTDKLPEQIHPKTGRVHTSYHQAAVATGRLSSSDPNLQNIPIRTEEGRRIRQAFIAAKGCKIIAADYSQIELRIMAHLAQDPNLLNAFAEGLDIHKATAAEIFNIPLDAVTHDQRRSAKAINFGLIYGMSAFGLAKQLGIERNAAQAYMERYFTRYPNVKHYMETTRQQAHHQGYVTTLFGRRLPLPEINSKNMARQKASERAAINAPMQGTAADIIKIAMIKIDQVIQAQQLQSHMIMQVHDELVFEATECEIETMMTLIQTQMTDCPNLSVPLMVDIGIGNNWDEAH